MVTKEDLKRLIDITTEQVITLNERPYLNKELYYDLGYYKGRLAVLETWLNELENEK